MDATIIFAMSDLPPLLQWVNEKLDVEVRPWPMPGQSGLAAYRVDLSRLRMKLSEAAPCIEVSREVAATLSPVQLKRMLMDTIYAQGWHRRNVLVLVPGKADDLKLLCKSETLPPLVLDEAAQTRITFGRAKHEPYWSRRSANRPASRRFRPTRSARR